MERLLLGELAKQASSTLIMKMESRDIYIYIYIHMSKVFKSQLPLRVRVPCS